MWSFTSTVCSNKLVDMILYLNGTIDLILIFQLVGLECHLIGTMLTSEEYMKQLYWWEWNTIS